MKLFQFILYCSGLQLVLQALRILKSFHGCVLQTFAWVVPMHSLTAQTRVILETSHNQIKEIWGNVYKRCEKEINFLCQGKL